MSTIENTMTMETIDTVINTLAITGTDPGFRLYENFPEGEEDPLEDIFRNPWAIEDESPWLNDLIKVHALRGVLEEDGVHLSLMMGLGPVTGVPYIGVSTNSCKSEMVLPVEGSYERLRELHKRFLSEKAKAEADAYAEAKEFADFYS